MKKTFIGFAILVLIVGIVSAFTISRVHHPKVTGEKWFRYKLNDNTGISNPANYELFGDGSTQPSCPTGNDVRCAVKALPSSNPQQPDLSTVIIVKDKAL